MLKNRRCLTITARATLARLSTIRNVKAYYAFPILAAIAILACTQQTSQRSTPTSETTVPAL